jgi:hypothetical protein
MNNSRQDNVNQIPSWAECEMPSIEYIPEPDPCVESGCDGVHCSDECNGCGLREVLDELSMFTGMSWDHRKEVAA